MIYRKSDSNSEKKIAEYLKAGKIVILPTDTVYGFSGITGSATGCYVEQKIREIKGRDETKPFIQLIAKPCDIFLYTNDKLPEKLLSLWPGALTIIVNTADGTTAFRCPGDEWLRKVIELCGSPIYSTSVNRSGKPVLQTVHEIVTEFESEVDAIIDDGDKKDAAPSTIVRIDDGEIKIIRQGDVSINH